MTILITGGAGYIGSHTNKLLHRRGYSTLVFDNLVRGHRDLVRWGEFVLGDLADIEQLRLCFKSYSIQAVMHFGAFAYVGESVTDPSMYYANNVANTINLLNAMVEHGVRSLVFSSSCAAYGIPEHIPITEEHPLEPINPYGRAKRMVEQILKDYEPAYGLSSVSLRYFNAAGADPDGEIGERHEPETHLIPLVLHAAIGKTPDVRVYGTDYDTPDGTCIRDYVHVSDLAEAHILALEYLQAGGKSTAFNLGNGNGFSVREVVRTVERITGRRIGTVEAARRPGDPPALIGSAQKARDILGWTRRYQELPAIIQTAWEWHKRDLRG